jgi:hypothetical protein
VVPREPREFLPRWTEENCDLFDRIACFQRIVAGDLESNRTVRERRERYFTKQFHPHFEAQTLAVPADVELKSNDPRRDLIVIYGRASGTLALLFKFCVQDAS